MEKINFERFALATAHRAENVDDATVLNSIVKAFSEAPIPIVYPMHPRTKKRLHQSRIYAKLAKSRNVQILSPLGYLDFLVLMKNCEFLVTDSGGIQEEATAPNIRKRVLVIRLSTERPEAVSAGFADIVGTETLKILTGMQDVLDHRRELPEKSPYGEGNAAQKIVEIIKHDFAFDDSVTKYT
jgi:UDP-N-acetylglucosamine 2-epimerase (non-hydrolysing)